MKKSTFLAARAALIACGSSLILSASAAAAPAAPAAAAAATEAKALMTQHICFTCHTIDGTSKINGADALGPTLKGIYGTTETVLTDGKEREVKVDDAYLTKSIREPMADIVKGRLPVMVLPPPALTDAEIGKIVAFIKTLK